MEKHYRCVRFTLYDIKNISFNDFADEIKMSFYHRAKCHIHSEDYKRLEGNMFIIIEVIGDSDAIDEAIKESQYTFNKYCKKSFNEVWYI